MDMITTNLCMTMVSFGKRINEEFICPMHTQMTGGPSRRTRKSTKRAIEDALISNVKDLLQVVIDTAKDLTKVVEELQG